MDYYSQLRAMNNAQSAYDGQEAPEYYEDDDVDEEWLAKQREDSEDEQHQARGDNDED